MNDPQTKRPTYAWCVLAIVCMLALYVLSIGPACWLMSRDYGQQDTLTRVYRPIVWIAAVGPRPVYEVAVWYLHLWTGQDWGINLNDHSLILWAPPRQLSPGDEHIFGTDVEGE